MRPRILIRPLAVLLAGAACAAAARAEPAPAGRQAFEVNVYRLGAEADRDALAGARAFVSRLDARPGFSAVDQPVPPRSSWDARPDDQPPDGRIALVAVAFGARTDWLAFAFDTAGAPCFAVRRPARQWDTQGIYPDAIPPGDKQIDRNAGIELASDFGLGWPAGRQAAAAQPPIAITVTAADSADSTGMPVQPAEREGLRALLTAAALRQGHRPAGGDAGMKWVLTAAKEPDGFDLALEWREPDKAPRRVRARADRESLFGYLERMIRALAGWDGAVADFMVTDPGGPELVGWQADTLFMARDGELTAWTVSDGQRAWGRPKPERQTPLFTFAPWSATNRALIQYQPGVERINPETGAGERGTPSADVQPWGVAVGREDSLVLANGATLLAVSRKPGAKPGWTVRGADEWRAGPLVADGAVWAGNLSGELVCVNESDGRERWRVFERERWTGPLQRAGDCLLAASREGGLSAFRLADGTRAWRVEAGDTILRGPAESVHGWLAATRAGRVLRVDEKSGAVQAEWQAGEPTAGFTVVSSTRAAWSGRGGRIVFLELPGLTPVREVRLGARLKDGLVAAPDAPAEWRTGESLIGARQPLVLAADEEGFVYALSIP